MPKAAQHFPDAESLESEKGVNLDVCQCSGCGLVQLGNDPVPYYRDVIRAAAFSEEMKDFRLKQFAGFAQAYSLEGKKVIEIGCGRGEYLSLIGQFGPEAYGLEHSEESVRHCIRNGLRVSQGFIHTSDCKLDHAPFDGFYVLNFLEHLPDPNSLLRGIYKNLTNEAVGLVEVPNFDMILKQRLFSEFIGDHLCYFTKETLNTTLGLNGFEIIDHKELWYNYILSAVVKKKHRMDLSSIDNYQLYLKQHLCEFINRFDNKQVAIWGAGHQALAIISLMNLSDRIKYVVDSALFKQNKYTPASHIPVVSPDTLHSDPVDAVIVMAASYSDEVATILRDQYDSRIQVSIVRDYGLELL
jgi:2-polyprenyl-3-methyl-5-hydroxy-6-metoxy-1,4-benzoquinol methylase